jgi:Domain of unknown function (DUF4730)
MDFFSSFLFLVGVLFAFSGLPVANAAGAFDTGDTIALILGIVLIFVVLCAFLGWYSRR